jgi:hypothetical protein
MPRSTVLDRPQEEQAQMLAVNSRAQDGARQTLHMLLIRTAGRTPTEIAGCLFCSRSGFCSTVRASHTSMLGMSDDKAGHLPRPVRTTMLTPSLGGPCWPGSSPTRGFPALMASRRSSCEPPRA